MKSIKPLKTSVSSSNHLKRSSKKKLRVKTKRGRLNLKSRSSKRKSEKSVSRKNVSDSKSSRIKRRRLRKKGQRLRSGGKKWLIERQTS